MSGVEGGGVVEEGGEEGLRGRGREGEGSREVSFGGASRERRRGFRARETRKVHLQRMVKNHTALREAKKRSENSQGQRSFEGKEKAEER